MRIIMILIWCLPMLPYFARLWLFIVVALCAPYAAAQNTPATTQALLHALDYLAVDYPHVIKNGEIVNADEYAEQQEFAQQSVKLIDQLPAHADKAALVRSAHELKDAIDQHMPGPEVQSQARDLAATVIRAYQVNVAPAAVPSVRVGAELYQQHCAACHGDAGRRHGAALWQQGRYHDVFTGLTQVTQAMPAAIAAQHGDDGVAVLAYLRAEPQQVGGGRPSPLTVAQQKLGESIAAYRAGDNGRAYDLAVAAYLEGFELAEKSLSNVDAEQKTAIEPAMSQYRQAAKQAAPLSDAVARAAALQTQLSGAAATLDQAAGNASPAVNFVSALVILLREGVEAFLVLAAIVAFLIKTGRRDALIYVHLGWLAAVVAGAATWFATKSLVNFSGADREVVEGTVALIAAGMLLYVGYWLHSHSNTRRWQQFVRSHVSDHLSSGTVRGLSLVSFIAVYREVAETILFYEALWLQAGTGGHGALIAGIGAAAILLLLIAWLMFRLSIRLPLQLFFRVNAALLVTLAVIFAGKGVAALQEAGKLPANHINFPQIDLLGIHPSAEGIGLQAVMVVMALAWLAYNRLRPDRQEVIVSAAALRRCCVPSPATIIYLTASAIASWAGCAHPAPWA